MPRDDIARQPYHAFHRRQRQGVGFLRYPHDQRLADRQRERQTNRESRSLAVGRVDEQAAAQLFDFGRDDIHADAAARGLRDVTGGAEARLQYELHGLLIGEFRMSIDQAERDRLLADQLDVDAGAIIGHDDDDFRAVALQAD